MTPMEVLQVTQVEVQIRQAEADIKRTEALTEEIKAQTAYKLVQVDIAKADLAQGYRHGIFNKKV